MAGHADVADQLRDRHAAAALQQLLVNGESPWFHLRPLFCALGGQPRQLDVEGRALRRERGATVAALARDLRLADLRRLQIRREAIRVSWFATAGKFDVDRTDRSADDTTATSSNTWTPPAHAGDVHLWIVLRDDRGGSGWQSYRISVTD